jgi:hypothetical protein
MRLARHADKAFLEQRHGRDARRDAAGNAHRRIDLSRIEQRHRILAGDERSDFQRHARRLFRQSRQ